MVDLRTMHVDESKLLFCKKILTENNII